MLDFKTNFFSKAATSPAPTMSEIMWANDGKFRAGFGLWMYERFDELAREYQKHGRFLTLSEIQDSPLDL